MYLRSTPASPSSVLPVLILAVAVAAGENRPSFANDLTGGRSLSIRDEPGFGSKNRFKAKFSKDLGITAALSDPTATRSTIRVLSNLADTGAILLDPQSWSRAGTGYKLKFSDPSHGEHFTIKIRPHATKGGRLLAKLTGARYGIAELTGPVAWIETELRIGGDLYCGRFESPISEVKKNARDKIAYKGPSTACPPRQLDAIFADALTPRQACLGDGFGGFSCADFGPHMPFSTGGVAVADVNGDAYLDVVAAGVDVAQVCLGDGLGALNCSDMSADTDNTASVSLLDFNADGFLDAYLGDVSSEDRMCLGDGVGGFSCTDSMATPTGTSDAAVALLNGGGVSYDVVRAINGGLNSVCDSFVAIPGFADCQDVGTELRSTVAVALGWADGDRELDAFFANLGQANEVCVEVRGGTTDCTDVDTNTDMSLDVAVGDLNGDGYTDVVYANGVTGGGEPNRVCLAASDGSLAYTCTNVSADVDESWGVALGDVDDDGKLDAVFANRLNGFSGAVNRVCYGDGSGAFSACSDATALVAHSFGVALGNLNN